MIKLILVGVWACMITVASNYAATHIRAAYFNGPAEQAPATVESHKTKEINIPKIRDGVVKGYIVTQLTYVADAAAMKKLPVPADPFVVDEVFRYIFNDDTIDFDHLQTYDLAKMTKALIKNINTRLKSDVVTDIAYQEFTFLENSDAKAKP
jgi:hypothetical protein